MMKPGVFAIFMSYSRQWMEEVGSEDSHGRALWGLGKAVAFLDNPGQLALTTTLFNRALKACRTFYFAPRHRFYTCGHARLSV